MVQPIDYTSATPDLTRQFAGLSQALDGYGIYAQQQRAAEQAAKLKQQYDADIKEHFKNPTGAGAAQLVARYPAQREAILEGWKVLSAEQQQNELRAGNEVFAALQNGRPDIAQKRLESRIVAAQNSGEDISEETRILDMIKTDPKQASGYLGFILANLDDKFAENFGKLGSEGRAADQAPAALREKVAGANKAEADASTAATTAKFAESKAVMDLKMSDEQIKKWSSDTDIARQNSRIAAMNAAISRESNDLKRQELGMKVQEAIAARDDKLRGKVAEAQSGYASMDNFLNTADRFLSAASIKGKSGKLEASDTLRAAAGPLDSRMPTLQGDVSDLEALAETLGSQAFLSQVPAMKGLGALTETEGAKLTSSLVNLSLKQRPEQLLKNVQEAQRLILKARGNLSTKLGVPQSTPDTPDAQPSATEVDDLLRKYGPR